MSHRTRWNCPRSPAALCNATMLTKVAVAIAAAVLTGAVGACSSGTPPTAGESLLDLPVPAHVTVGTRNLPGLGTVLVDGQGRTLYMFPPDAGSRVTCTGFCAGTWPPLVIAIRATPTAGRGANAEDLGTLADPNSGARIVTYAGYPLYRYAGDLHPGAANGQALFVDSGPWYVVTPNGQPVTTDPGRDS